MAPPAPALLRDDTKTDTPLQAIVLCDAWGEERRWQPLVRPLTDDDDDNQTSMSTDETRPWCLLPLLGCPLLAWTLESLAAGGVEQCFLFAREGVDPIRTWLASVDPVPSSLLVCYILTRWMR